MRIEIVQVDAFTAEPFCGNPAAICVLESEPDAEWMQRLALEMNLSETAYLIPQNTAFKLRWFTPGTEVDLCGHATVAAAHVLWEDGHVAPDRECRFHTRSGELVARRNGRTIAVDFPFEEIESFKLTPALTEILGIRPTRAMKNRLGYILAEVATEDEVRACTPDFAALKHESHHGYIVTAAAMSDGIDFVSRFFAPAMGIDEDPVTGSAHCVLGTYWQERMGKGLFQAYQASARGGDVGVEMLGSRVRLSGQAVTVMRGVLEAAATPGV